MKITYNTPRASSSGWRYFWAKTVNGFDPSVHCARCLIGDYVREIGTRMTVNQPIAVPIPAGGLLYICGVSMPYKWANNFHMVLRAKAGATASVACYNGDSVFAEDAELVPIVATDAAELYPDRGKDFLTCRNFQFGASLGRAKPTVVRVVKADREKSRQGVLGLA